MSIEQATEWMGRMTQEPVEANYSTLTTVEHKITFYIDGQKYGFRCNDEFLTMLLVREGAPVPYIQYDWQTDELDLSVEA